MNNPAASSGVSRIIIYLSSSQGAGNCPLREYKLTVRKEKSALNVALKYAEEDNKSRGYAVFSTPDRSAPLADWTLGHDKSSLYSQAMVIIIRLCI